MKNTLDMIFKSGENFQFKNLDYDDPEIRKQIEETRKKQEESLRRNIITTADLEQIIITI